MAKTRSQARNITVKKEEEEEDYKSTLRLNGVTMITRNKIAKRKPSKRNNRRLPVLQVKIEEDTDTKSLLKSVSKSVNRAKGQYVSQEQINQLIDAIVNDNMDIAKAALKAKISYATGFRYYNIYKNDPEKKIPLTPNRFVHPPRVYTQEHIENLIRYITTDKLDVKEASAKANLSYNSGRKYYNKYLKDPNHAIPIPPSRQYYRQDQINQFIGYIVNDKMSINAASKKAKMGVDTGRKYYHKYFDDGNPDIASPSHITVPKHYTQDQKNKLISYIIDDKMSIAAASRKANIHSGTATCYYRKYMQDHNLEKPMSKYSRRYTQDQKDDFIRYIVDDKMNIPAASRKANIRSVTARYYYQQYMKDHNMEKPMSKYSRRYTQDQKDDFIRYIVDDKMNMPAASKKANMYYDSARKYLRRYLKKNNLDISTRRSSRRYPQDRVDGLIGYIVDDKMTIKAASRKANMNYSSGIKYYQKYRVNHNLDMSNPKCTAQDKVNELIGYIVNDKMTIAAASRKAKICYDSGKKYYQQYLINNKGDTPA